QRGEDQLEGRLLVLRVPIDRDAAAVVGDRGRCAILVEHDHDAIGVAVHGLVDRVVDDLPQEVVQPRGIDAADVHARPAPHRLEALEDQDVLRGVARRHPLPLHPPDRAHPPPPTRRIAATPPRFTPFCPLPPRLPTGTSASPSLRSPPSGVIARNVDGSGSDRAPTRRSSEAGRMRMTPRPGPDSSATSSVTKRTILPLAVAVTAAGPRIGSTRTTPPPLPTRARPAAPPPLSPTARAA